MSSQLTNQERGNRYLHKATGVYWYCSTDGHTVAPHVLRLYNRRSHTPSCHRFVSEAYRDAFVAKFVKQAAIIDHHKATNFYPTPPEATRALLSVEAFDGPIWEPACGQGHIVKVLEEAGLDVIATDLNDWQFGTPGIDFLGRKHLPFTERARHIITNPPYGRGLADAFVKRALAYTAKSGGKVAMLLNLASLAHEQRTEQWKANPPARLYAVDGVVCWPDPNTAPPKHFTANRYVWAIWEQGHSGPSAFWWLSSAPFRRSAIATQFNIKRAA